LPDSAIRQILNTAIFERNLNLEQRRAKLVILEAVNPRLRLSVGHMMALLDQKIDLATDEPDPIFAVPDHFKAVNQTMLDFFISIDNEGGHFDCRLE
jgi:hypothetical protein